MAHNKRIFEIHISLLIVLEIPKKKSKNLAPDVRIIMYISIVKHASEYIYGMITDPVLKNLQE